MKKQRTEKEILFEERQTALKLAIGQAINEVCFQYKYDVDLIEINAALIEVMRNYNKLGLLDFENEE